MPPRKRDPVAFPGLLLDELVFHSADYFAAQTESAQKKQILNVVVVRITLPDPEMKYHIPLVLSPHSYTLWWSG